MGLPFLSPLDPIELKVASAIPVLTFTRSDLANSINVTQTQDLLTLSKNFSAVTGIFSNVTPSTTASTGSLQTQSIGVAGNIWHSIAAPASAAFTLFEQTATTSTNALFVGIKQNLTVNNINPANGNGVGLWTVITDASTFSYQGVIGVVVSATHSGAGTAQFSDGMSISSTQKGGTGTVTSIRGIRSQVSNNGGGLVTNLFSYYANLSLSGSIGGTNTLNSTINAAGLHVERPSVGNITGNNCTNLYGVYVADNTALGANITVANTYGFYSAGTAPNFFGGDVLAPSATLTTSSTVPVLTFTRSDLANSITATQTLNLLTFSQGVAATTATFSSLTSGTVVANGSGLLSGSDIRLKRDIQPIEDAVNKVSQITGVTFKWNEESKIEDTSDQIGVIAQDVQLVLPQVVKQVGEYLAVDYSKIVPLLIEAIKAQQIQIAWLTTKITASNN